MERIDRLLIKAKKAARSHAERLTVAFVTHDLNSGIYAAVGHLWNGQRGNGVTLARCECASEAEAVDALHELANKYPNSEDVTIFYGDLED